MPSGDGSQRARTTQAVLDAAMTELVTSGQAEFAMERVAKRAYFSIGTLYQRWPDKASLLHALVLERLEPSITEALQSAKDASAAIDWALSDGRDQLVAMGEILLAAHGNATLSEAAQGLWRSLHTGLSRHLPSPMAWCVATYAVGNALLLAIDVHGPDPATGRTRWFVDAGARLDTDAPLTGTTAPPENLQLPRVPPPTRSDPVATALVSAAQLLLQERGAEGTSTRDIAAGAGVTTGALYRRYDGKSRLLADVLLTQLHPDRYTWTWDLVKALAGQDPYGGAADVITRRLIEQAVDLPSQRVLLQVGVAARSDPALRAQISERIRIADDTRVEVVRHFIDVGLLRGDIDPHVLTWGFQAIPVGLRALLPLGVAVDEAQIRSVMRALVVEAAPDE